MAHALMHVGTQARMHHSISPLQSTYCAPHPRARDGFNPLDPIAVVVPFTVPPPHSHHQLDSIRGRHRHHRVRAGRGVLTLRARQPRAVFFTFGSAGTFRAAAIMSRSYTGFDIVATMTEEAKNPGRDVPLGLISSILVITLVYCDMPHGARGDAAVQRH